MKVYDDDGRELTPEEVDNLPIFKERRAANDAFLSRTRDDVIRGIAERSMNEPHPPASMEVAMELASQTYESMTAEGE